MKVMFITMAWPKDGECNLYTDLMEEFQENGHQVTVVALNEKVNKQKTYLTIHNNIQIIRIRTGNMQKRNKYCKVIFSFLAGPQILYAIHKYLKGRQYELILFSTPPITLTPCIILLKKRYRTKLYLLLKDIWPQDAVDLGAMKKGGMVWNVFRYLEKKIYKNSDYIGCMSPANVEYIIKNNKYLQVKKVEVCPNSLKKRDFIEADRGIIREKYGLSKDKIIFIYGGNFGKAQGVEFLITIIQTYQYNPYLYFLLIGSGTEYDYLINKINSLTCENAKVVPWIPRTEFADLVKACDVGLILLNKKSTVPNFPSRLLTYLLAKIPIIAAVDKVTDIGDIIEDSSCGLKVYHGDLDSFKIAVEKVIISQEDRKKMGENGFQLFLEKYTTNQTYEIIIRHFLESETHENLATYSQSRVKKQISFRKGRNMSKLKSMILDSIHKVVNFTCFGDLPNSFYLKRGMKIGTNFHRQSATKFDPSHCYLIEIGDNVTIANNVQILAHDQSPRVYLGYGKVGRVVIGDNTFIGTKTLILPNVVIGDNVIIGAGSVVTKNVPSNSVAAGVPAKVIGKTYDYIDKCKEELLIKPVFNSTYRDGKKLSDWKKTELVKACKDDYVYMELGKVIEYGRRKY